jgi:hypothetical protein
MFRARVGEVLGSNISWDSAYPGLGFASFPHSLQAHAAKLSRLGHRRSFQILSD